MVSTHMPGGKISALYLNYNLLSKRKVKSSFFLFLFQAALRPLATRQRGKKNGEVEGVSVLWGERLIRYQEKESEGGRVENRLLAILEKNAV